MNEHEQQKQVQEAELDRVNERIGAAILKFARLRMQIEPRFVMQHLVDYVRGTVGDVAPDSPGRILRMLRKRRELDYVVVRRSLSLYEFKAVA